MFPPLGLCCERLQSKLSVIIEWNLQIVDALGMSMTSSWQRIESKLEQEDLSGSSQLLQSRKCFLVESCQG